MYKDKSMREIKFKKKVVSRKSCGELAKFLLFSYLFQPGKFLCFFFFVSLVYINVIKFMVC